MTYDSAVRKLTAKPSVDPFPGQAREKIALYGLLAACVAIALVGALDTAGSWNDGSRLATVECLVDYGTLAIDRSIFVQVPPQPDPTVPGPYPWHDRVLREEGGTQDKILVDGQYYSHKSPTPALLLAAWYWVWSQCTGLTARSAPDQFCYWMTFPSSGLAYLATVLATFVLTCRMGVGTRISLLLSASLALSTMALSYARQVNDHILLLAVASLLTLRMSGAAKLAASDTPWRREAWALGCLSGLGYTIDLGTGPLLMLSAGAWLAWRSRHWGAILRFSLGALPWLALHHAVNWMIGGTLRPVASVPAFFQWPGSAFDPSNLTGVWHHASLWEFARYAWALLWGIKGFVSHNLPLLLALGGWIIIWRQQPASRPELTWAAAWAGGTWLVYAAFSNNYSGNCVGIRWFLPLLAPGYLVLALLLRTIPRCAWDLIALSLAGAVIAALAWRIGPWALWPLADQPIYKLAQWAGLTGWLIVAGLRIFVFKGVKANNAPSG